MPQKTKKKLVIATFLVSLRSEADVYGGATDYRTWVASKLNI